MIRTSRPRPSPIRLGAIGVLVLLAVASPSRARAQGLVVVVNPANSLSELSMDKLRRLFLGQTRTFPDGSHARLARHTSSAGTFDRRALGLQPDIVRSRWMAMIFRGEQTTLPAELASVDDVKRFVREHPDAIAFLPSGQADATVKVVAVDGKRPADAGYPIH
jgi:hypothetical protein